LMPSTLLLTHTVGDGACSYTARDLRATRRTAAMATVTITLLACALNLDGTSAVILLAVLLMGWRCIESVRVTEESLTVIEGIGLQLRTRSANGRETAQFIELASISAIFLTEAVRCDRCYFYLACLLQEREGGRTGREGPELVVPFRHLRLPLGDLQHVCRGATAVLWRGAEPLLASPPQAMAPRHRQAAEQAELAGTRRTGFLPTYSEQRDRGRPLPGWAHGEHG
jgi:hypothetical protein